MNSYRVLRTFKSDSKRDIQTLDYSPRVHNWIILLYLVCKSWLETMQDKNRILFSTFWILFIAIMQIIIIIRNLNYLAHLIRSMTILSIWYMKYHFIILCIFLLRYSSWNSHAVVDAYIISWSPSCFGIKKYFWIRFLFALVARLLIYACIVLWFATETHKKIITNSSINFFVPLKFISY